MFLLAAILPDWITFWRVQNVLPICHPPFACIRLSAALFLSLATLRYNQICHDNSKSKRWVSSCLRHKLTAGTRCRQRGRDPVLLLLTLSSVYGNERHHYISESISGLFPDGRNRSPHLSLFKSLFSLQHWSWPINLDFSQVVGGWAVIQYYVISWWAYY